MKSIGAFLPYGGMTRAEELENMELEEIGDKAEDLAEEWLSEPKDLAQCLGEMTQDEEASMATYDSLMCTAKDAAQMLDAANRRVQIIEGIVRRVARKEAERQHKADQDPTNSSQFED